MSLPPTLVALPQESRVVILRAVTSVLRDAKTGYAPATPSAPKSGWVDFHIWAAQQARQLVADAVVAADGTFAVELSLPQGEALSKILARSRWVSRSPEHKKLALAVRKAINAAEETPTE